jgi:hypothetical protein
MDCKITFKERVALAVMQLSKQKPVTLEEAKKKVLWLKKNSLSKNKKLNISINWQ